MFSNMSFLQNLGLHLIGCSWCSQRRHCSSMTISLEADLHASWKSVPSSSISLQIYSYPTNEFIIVVVIISISITCSVKAGHLSPCCLCNFKCVEGWLGLQYIFFEWMNEWMNGYMMDPNLCSVRLVSQGLVYSAWDVCSINSAQVSKTNFASISCPGFSWRPEAKRQKPPGRHIINIIVLPWAQSPTHSSFLSSLN